MPILTAVFLSVVFPLNFFNFGQVQATYIPKPSIFQTPKFAIIPSPAFAPKNIFISIPTSIPLPTATPFPVKNTPAPTLIQSGPSPTSIPVTADKKTFIMNAVNDFRRSKGLSTVRTDPYTCNFAKTRAQEITQGFNHDGFTNRVNSKTLPYPSYQRITENLAQSSDYKNVVNLWANSPGHAANMQADTPYVCVESNGNFYAYEGWKP